MVVGISRASQDMCGRSLRDNKKGGRGRSLYVWLLHSSLGCTSSFLNRFLKEESIAEHVSARKVRVSEGRWVMVGGISRASKEDGRESTVRRGFDES